MSEVIEALDFSDDFGTATLCIFDGLYEPQEVCDGRNHEIVDPCGTHVDLAEAQSRLGCR